MRRVSLVAAVMLAVLGVTGVAGAKGRVHATLTSSIPADASGGEHVRLAWRLRDGAGRPVARAGVFVRIVCPEGTDSTTTYATRGANGAYRAVAVVPPGGIGRVTIGAKGTTFPITNLRRS